MFPSILNRMVCFELVKVFVLSMVGMTGILVMAGIVTYASQQGLSPVQIVAAIPLLVPDMLPYSVPTTMLFATCIVYGRLAHDNEILAIKAAGINVLKVIWPGLILGMILSCTTLGLYYYIIPYSHHLMKSMFMNDVEEVLYALLRKDGQIKRPELNYAMWVHRVQGRRLQDALFKRRDASGRYDVIAAAREAELRVDLEKKLLIVYMRHCQTYSEGSEQTRLYFDDKIWELPLPTADAKAKMRTRDMTWQQVLERRREAALEADNYSAQIAMTTARLLLSNPPSDLNRHLTNLQYVYHHRKLELNALTAELQMRPALSFGCLCFVLVGAPVGIWFSRSDYLSAFITCFLPIVFVYYPLLLCGNNLARDGKVHPVIGIWAANAMMTVIALFLFRRLLKN